MHSDPSDDLGQAQLGCSDLASMCREWSKHKRTAQSIVVNTYKIHRDAFTIRSIRSHLHSFRRCPQHWRAEVVPSCWKKCRANGGQNNMIKCPQVLPSQCPLCTLVPHRIQLVAVFFYFFAVAPQTSRVCHWSWATLRDHPTSMKQEEATTAGRRDYTLSIHHFFS